MATTPRSVAWAFFLFYTFLFTFSPLGRRTSDHLTIRRTFVTDKSGSRIEARKPFQPHVVERAEEGRSQGSARCLVESAPGGFAWTERVKVLPVEASPSQPHDR